MSAEKFVAFDTETTGLSPIGDRIVEIAAVAFRRDGSELDVFEQLVDPGIPIPPELTAIHGITDEMVAGKPRIQQVLPDFLRFVDRAVLVAHNAPYDVSMLLVPLVRMTLADGPQTVMRAGDTAGNLALDTCTLARAVFPGAPNYRLGTVAEMLGIPRGRAHRAMPDVLTCKELFLRILSKLPPDIAMDELVRMNGSELRLGIDERMLASLPLVDARAVLLLKAMRSATPVMIEYQGGTKGSGPRLVTPITMMAHGTAASLIAQCHLDGGLKNFRLERISAVYPLPVS
ncbi:MAG TPA: exonuclease domain-containing protein [Patescibacteria group bacterium]|nr:exonuclease domain-containing protein [Patescibacteria group bacterium]